MANRLSTLDAELDGLLMLADVSACKRAASVAAEAAVVQSELAVDSRYLAARLEASQLRFLVNLLDSEYFQAQSLNELGQTTEHGTLVAFGKARAANSMLYVLTENPSEAIYEAILSAKEPAAISLVVRNVLRNGT